VSTVDAAIRIPAGVTDHEAFRRWIRSVYHAGMPRVSYLAGVIWVEAPLASGIDKGVRIPKGITDLESFRRWARSGDIPENVRVSYLRGDLWVDLSMEQAYTHGRVKLRIASVLDNLADAEDLGQVFPDGMYLSHREAGLSTEPDAMFVSYDALRTGRIRRIEGTRDGCVEFEGTPDMVLEVVSDTSARIDTKDMVELYWQAGIREYWLVDARGEPLRFDILRRGAKKYVATRRQAGGWLKSEVFGRNFRLTRDTDPVGDPRFRLAVRP
jgi:Uma2 family endonuclease